MNSISGFRRKLDRLGHDRQDLCGVAKVEPRLDPPAPQS